MEDNTGLQKKTEEEQQQEEKAKIEALKLSVFVTDTMSRKSGRDFVWHLLENYGVYRSPFSPNSNKMARNVGTMEAGQYLMQLLLMECPSEYERMFAEHRYKEENDDK